MTLQRYGDYQYDMEGSSSNLSLSLSEQIAGILVLIIIYFGFPFLIWLYVKLTEIVKKLKEERKGIEKTKEVKPVNEPIPNTPQKRDTIERLCKELGIPYSKNQRQEGTASVRFMNKPKDKETE